MTFLWIILALVVGLILGGCIVAAVVIAAQKRAIGTWLNW